ILKPFSGSRNEEVSNLPEEFQEGNPVEQRLTICDSRMVLQNGIPVRQVSVQWVGGSPKEAMWEWLSEFQVVYLAFYLEDKVIFEEEENVMSEAEGGGGRTKRVSVAPSWHKDFVMNTQQQRDLKRGRRRAADRYRFSREVRTEVHSTESHKYGDEREQIRQRAAYSDSQHTADSDKQNQTKQIISDAKRGKTRRNQTDAEPDVTNITRQPKPFNTDTNTNINPTRLAGLEPAASALTGRCFESRQVQWDLPCLSVSVAILVHERH
ncbi:hypothetical protein Tco_0982452, partial [Tanacetum coccineum]